jgi:thymidylate synthase ThyX
MQSRYGTAAYLVWDGGDEVRIPDVMGKPAENQMQGTPGERLSELAGRVCYDSLGKGRSSPDYHTHIKEVGHGSVYEHVHMTVFLTWNMREPFAIAVFLNRPGVWIRMVNEGIRVTFNPRVVLDWEAFGSPFALERDILHHHASQAWPMIISPRQVPRERADFIKNMTKVVEPDHDEERWVTLFVSGSRGFSHELVRHGDFTAISQRSTRFVDEDGSPWIDHPLVMEFMREASDLEREEVALEIGDVKMVARKVYADLSERLQKWLIEKKNVDKFTARKQARGAARGYLGNALETEVIFSASIAQWKRMLKLRACDPADAEIRSVFIEAFHELRKSRYADCFSSWERKAAKDGIGETVVAS